MIQKPKGTKDIIDNIDIFLFLENTFRQAAKSFNYNEIRTPIFENKELFIRAVGEETDVVSKEIYDFEDKGGRILALRPEATASVVRAVIENKLIKPNEQTKLFYMGKMFRYERPQKGRQREFNQFGIETIGEANVYTDLEAITFATLFLKSVGISNVLLKINTLGTEEERQNYKVALRNYLEPKLNTLCSNCNLRFEKNILRILDCKSCKLNEDLPKLYNYLSDKTKEEFELIKTNLKDLGIEYKVDSNLVRGLDYYSNTVFEIEPIDSTTSQAAILGGGRYTKLLKQLGGPNLPGTGFAIGVERLVNFIIENKININEPINKTIFMICKKEFSNKGFKILTELRDNNITVDFNPSFTNIDKQFNQLKKINAHWALIINEDTTIEKLEIKNQDTQETYVLTLKELIKKIKGD